jgi:hypothetical protein
LIFVIEGSFSSEYYPRIISTFADWDRGELQVDFIIKTDNGSLYSKLQMANLKVTSNEKELLLKQFSRNIKLLPYKFFFVIDKSGSMGKNNNFQKAIHLTQIILNDYGNEVTGSFITAADNIDFFAKVHTIIDSLKLINPGGNTRLYDGIYATLRNIENALPGIPAIFVLTDGEDISSKYTISDCLLLNDKLSIPIFIAIWGNPNKNYKKDMERLSELSNGLIFQADSQNVKITDFLPKKGMVYSIAIDLPDLSGNDSWIDFAIISLIEGQSFKVSKTIELKNPFKKSVSTASTDERKYFMYIIIIFSIALLIGISVWFGHRNTTTKKCPFCSKRYKISESDCPYCHQNTMYFYNRNQNDNEGFQEQFKENSDYQNFEFRGSSNQNLNQTQIMESVQQHSGDDQTRVLTDVTPALAYLIIKKGDRVGREFPLIAGVNTLGRHSQNMIQIEDLAISHNHAKIFWKADTNKFVINDLASTNGTHINGAEVVQQELKDNDQIKIGQTELIFIQIL